MENDKIQQEMDDKREERRHLIEFSASWTAKEGRLRKEAERHPSRLSRWSGLNE